ncbi:hypothetical protein OBBRIDRAFT_724164 [Obba rivulosa]|uniref:NADH dehydrogenase [ubiquinone] 1 beta subcomplex subunit 3 n=1 Tax=Obba rivulosa TaxID=1052685 RepID=A0A8E2DQA6_9APHY|nr:hypothetical protein OBBRIDRAFT_724164 [Obba rivulosa]
MVNPPPIYRDPWAKRDAWRKHPVFAKRAMLSKMFPGFGVAVVAFTTYVVIDNMFLQPKHESHH